MQELGGIDGGHLQIGDIGVIDGQDLAGFLDVDDEFRLFVRGDNGSHARLGVVFIVYGHAARAFNTQGLQGGAVHDHVLRRPIGAGDRILVFPALIFGGFHRARFHADPDFGDAFRFFHPQVDHVDLGVTADYEDIAAGG